MRDQTSAVLCGNGCFRIYPCLREILEDMTHVCKTMIGESLSAGKLASNCALFESFTDHGKQSAAE